MEHNYNDIDELFQKSFENFEVEPPSEIKALIDKQIQFQSKRKLNKIWFLGIFALALVSSAIVFFSTRETKTILAQNTKVNAQESSLVKNDSGQSNIITKDTEDSINLNSHKKQKKSMGNESIQKQNTNNSKKSDLSPNKKSQINKETSSISTKSEKKQNSKSISSKKGRNNNLKSGLRVKKSKSKNIREKSTDKVNDYKKSNDKINDDLNSNLSQKTNSDKDYKSTDQNIDSKNSTVSNTSNIDKNSQAIDSTKTIMAQNIVDSSKNNSTSHNPAKNKRNIPLLLSLKTDYNVPFNKNTSEESFASKRAFHFQAEASYLFSPKFGATTGINYFSSNQSFTKTTNKVDSLFTGITYDPIFADSLAYIYDSNQNIIDSTYISYIIDSTAIENYELINSGVNKTNSFTINSFSIPLLLYYNQKLSDKIFLDLNAGAILNFQKIRFTDISNPLNSDLSLSKFGVKAILKTSLRYQFSHLGVSLNNNFMYDFAPIQLTSSKRKVLTYGLGIGVSWRF